MKAYALLVVALTACASPAAPPAAPPVRTEARSPVSPAPSTASPADGITLEEAEERDVRHGGYAVGVHGPLRVEAKAGTTARVEFVVTNTGDRRDVYDVDADHPVEPRRLTLAPGATATVVVRVPVPARGTETSVRVVVTSRSDPGVTDEATTTLHAR